MIRKNLLIKFFVIIGILALTACSSNRLVPIPTDAISIPVTGLETTPTSIDLVSSPTFNDVPYDYSETLGGVEYYLYDYIQTLFDYRITSGTSTNPRLYSPTEIIDRAHFAVFLLRAAFGSNYVPPMSPWKTFEADDWNSLPQYQQWAEGLYKAQLTNGCQSDPLGFCPTENLTRLQAVIFALLLKFNTYDEQGNLTYIYNPPPATGNVFADMTDPSFYGTSWAEAAYENNLLPECGMSGDKSLFCPDEPLDRAWAAYVVVEAKSLLP
jgi:hypothetical protein